VLAICASALFLVGLDTTIVTVALPQIGAGLGVPDDRLAWVVDAYTIPFASLLITSGALADRFGRRRVFRIGLAAFGAASLACAAAPTVGALVLARAVQGVGASMLTPVALAIVVSAMPDPRERAQAIGIWGAMFGLSMAVGPSAGGALIAALDWTAVFWVNVPLVVVAISLVTMFVPESRAVRARGLDPAGQVLLALLLALVVGVLIEGPRIGWTSPAALSAYGTIVLVVVGLCRVETRRDEPLIDPGLFRLPSLTGSVVSAVVVFVAFSATLLLTTILLQTGLGWTAGAAGAATLPMAVGAIAGAPLSGYLLARIGPRVPLLVAGGAILVGGVLLVTLAARMSLPALLMAFAAIGIGVGVSSPPITNTAVSSLPSARAGVAGGLTSSARQVGTAIGVALAGGLAAGGAVGPAVGPGSLLLGWVLVASCGAATMALALLAPHSARGPARQTVTGTEPSRETA
jgi:EmrB/QacA subfamily drug resistance transporter